VNGSIHMLSTAGETLAKTLARCGKNSELAGAAILDNPQVRKYGTRHMCTPTAHTRHAPTHRT
jgi:hypothetical protein